MADELFAVKAGERLFTLDKLTLGDFSMFKREFGIKADDIFTEVVNSKGETIQVVNLGDLDILIALMVAVLRRERPNVAVSVLRAEIEALDISDITAPESEQEEEEADPPQAADNAATERPAKSGKSGKRRN